MNRIRPHDDASLRARLAEPQGPVRVVIDTDAANEIDDQFALAWALLSPAQLRIEGIYAAPFSFAHRRAEMQRARAARKAPESADAGGRELLRRYAAQLDHFERRGWEPGRVDLPVFNPPGEGMERSWREIHEVFARLGLEPGDRVRRGSTRYLSRIDQPVDSDAAQHLIAAARSGPADEPLYVAAIGCVTNVASALLMAPDIAERIVVVWTSGYPSHAPHTNDSFNLEQDLLASRHLFDCGVALVYLPGFHVGAQLRLSLAEMEKHVRGRGAIGDYLYRLYTNNPLWDFLGMESENAYSWVIWDLIDFAWLMNPQWVPSEIVATPRLGDDRRWQAEKGRPPMREAYGVARDAIFGDFFAKLARASGAE
ncbi:MAG: nucleoside hydrolase [Burkholderiales bacterium]|nr:nucleoside hydrolase [Burkholderiales bacterium]MDE2395922.1 nucleoside hydrolase [Burkholderiales bacterium]MDE2457484.1 nucleoside hydrolase [Burkholderiales bacterium]